MFPYLFILGHEIELYHVFNFLAVFVVMILGIRWNYRKGNKYSMGMSILFFTAPLAFFIGRIFYFVFLACPASKMQFFNLEHGGSIFLGAFTGGVFHAFVADKFYQIICSTKQRQFYYFHEARRFQLLFSTHIRG